MSLPNVGRGFLLLIFLTIKPIWSILRINDIKIEDYYVGSSKLYRVNAGRNKRDVPISTRPEFLFDLKLYNDGRPFTVYIKQRDSDVLVDQATSLNIFNASSNSSIPISSQLYEGYVVDFPESSSVNGYVKDDNFYGHLIVNDTLYYIDELRDPKDRWDLPNGTIASRNALIFKRDSVIVGVIINETTTAKDLFQQLVKQNYFNKTFQTWKKKGRLCSMVVVIDYSFLTLVHNSNVEAAVFQVLFSMEEANAVFRSTDFDGDGIADNIGFYVKKLVVIDSPEPLDFVPEFQSEMKVDEYLVKFTRYEELANHCLGLIFTAQKFSSGTLGASFTPDSASLHPTSGICDENIPYLGTLNGLVITSSTSHTSLVNQVVFEVTIIHELGHSFGSTHDEPRCLGHVMSPKAYSDYYGNRTYVMFSPCSRDQIMRTLVMKGRCLEPVQTAFCGNGLVEEGEDCDCGLTRDCLQKDPCCVSRRTKEYPCKINRKKGFQCHPSQGECCASDCRYSTRLETFVNCKNFDQTCPCTNNQTNCSCGLNGMCLQAECHSAECVRLGLQECQCSNETTEATCQVCCQYENSCIVALEATNKVLSSEEKHQALAQLLQLKPDDESIYQGKQFVEKRFCVQDRCVSLPFSRGSIGSYCLHKGKLGKCEPHSQCNILQTKHNFPTFETASVQSSRNYLHMVCYVFLNSFLIYSFY